MRRVCRRRQRHERERPLAGVELGRDIVVRPGVPQRHRERGLAELMRRGVDPRRLAGRRRAPVGADDERRRQRAPVGERQPRGVGAEIEAGDLGVATPLGA